MALAIENRLVSNLPLVKLIVNVDCPGKTATGNKLHPALMSVVSMFAVTVAAVHVPLLILVSMNRYFIPAFKLLHIAMQIGLYLHPSQFELGAPHFGPLGPTSFD